MAQSIKSISGVLNLQDLMLDDMRWSRCNNNRNSVSHSVMSDSLQPMDYSQSGFSRQEYWSGLPCPPSRGSSQPRDQIRVSCIAGRFFTVWATREAPKCNAGHQIITLCSRCHPTPPHLQPQQCALETQGEKAQDTGPRELRSHQRNAFNEPKTPASFHTQESTEFLETSSFLLTRHLLMLQVPGLCSKNSYILQLLLYLFGAVPQSYLRYCVPGLSPQFYLPNKNNSQLLRVRICFQ